MTDDLGLKRIEKLWDDGVRLLNEGAYDRVLAIAEQLERERYSGAFDLGAQAYAIASDPCRRRKIPTCGRRVGSR